MGGGLRLAAAQLALAGRLGAAAGAAAQALAGSAGLLQPQPVQCGAACLAPVLQAVALGLAAVEQRVRLDLPTRKATQ